MTAGVSGWVTSVQRVAVAASASAVMEADTSSTINGRDERLTSLTSRDTQDVPRDIQGVRHFIS